MMMMNKLRMNDKRRLPGGGGPNGGPPGIGCCCKGFVAAAADTPGTAATPAAVPTGAFGSSSSHSELKSPELNLFRWNSEHTIITSASGKSFHHQQLTSFAISSYNSSTSTR